MAHISFKKSYLPHKGRRIQEGELQFFQFKGGFSALVWNEAPEDLICHPWGTIPYDRSSKKLWKQSQAKLLSLFQTRLGLSRLEAQKALLCLSDYLSDSFAIKERSRNKQQYKPSDPLKEVAYASNTTPA